jgi:aspartate aminotransferase
VHKAEDILHKQRNDKEYLPIEVSCPAPVSSTQASADLQGNADFIRLASELAYGKDSKPLKEGRVSFLSSIVRAEHIHSSMGGPADQQVAVAQSISGTGALRIATTFLSQYHKGPKEVYLPDPTWGNHLPVVEQTGMKVVRYRYFDKKTVGLDFEGMKEDIKVSCIAVQLGTP